jgi:uncharacterized membrane protein YhaH (DUF805 family)
MHWFIEAITQRYADFGGRARRTEFWFYTLFNFIIYMVLYVPWYWSKLTSGTHSILPSGWALVLFGVWLIYCVALLRPTLSIQIRRLHDTGRSGWWVLLGYIPCVNFIGSFVLLWFFCEDSQPGTNQYGPSPKYPNPSQPYQPPVPGVWPPPPTA